MLMSQQSLENEVYNAFVEKVYLMELMKIKDHKNLMESRHKHLTQALKKSGKQN